MDNKKDDKYYVEKILGDINFLIKHTVHLSRKEFENSEILLDSIMFRFIQISEHIKKLSIKFKKVHKEIPWGDIQGLRNRIVHEYGNVDLNIVFQAVKTDIYDIQQIFSSVFDSD